MAASTSPVEEAKRRAAQRAVDEHFSPTFNYVGIGSGTTILYVVEAIKAACEIANGGGDNEATVVDDSIAGNPAKVATVNAAVKVQGQRVLADRTRRRGSIDDPRHPLHHKIRFVPTGFQSREVIRRAGLTPIAFDSLPDDLVLDVAFDGADEVDDELNCIKGGGACLFQEKLVATRARKFVCVADYRKAQSRLLTKWPSIPIEVAPIAAHVVQIALRNLGSPDPEVRESGMAKAGPLKTDQDFFIIDAPFKQLLTASDVAAGKGKGDGTDGLWAVDQLAAKIKAITGVLEVGLFYGYDGYEAAELGIGGVGQKPVAVYFGMEDGSVKIRTKKGETV